MTTITQTKPWDLSHVLDFVNTFSPPKAVGEPPPVADDDGIFDLEDLKPHIASIDSVEARDFAPKPAALGDFGRVWQFLGTPNTIQGSTSSDAEAVPNKDDYASDGATYKSKRGTSPKNVHWSDNTDGSGEEPGSPTPASRALTKTQRKKANRKARKALDALKQNGTVSESEADSVSKQTPARKASAHVVQTASPARYDGRASRTRSRVATPDTPKSALPVPSGPNTIGRAVNAVAEALASIKREEAPATPTPNSTTTRAHNKTIAGAPFMNALQQHSKPWSPHQQLQQVQPQAAQQTRPQQYQSTPGQQYQPQAQQYQPVTPHSSQALQFLPSSVTPMLNGKPVVANQPPVRSITAAGTMSMPRPFTSTKPFSSTPPANANTVKKPKPQPVIEPRIVRSGEDRHLALLMKIIGDFYEDRKYLVSPMNLTTHNNDPKGIHVFVDASNIFIGFMDELKRSRGIHPMARVDQPHLSFDGLALLMERRRPVAKRCLVGSTPHLPAFDKAEAVGYECSILEKVYKARELTERQKYFKEMDARRYGRKKAPPCNNVVLDAGSPSSPGMAMVNGGSGSGSGSETNTPQYAPPAMIEQGVDEILHLKILESVIDSDEPSTIVLATGDAAAAEYSAGFMAMVQRALKKGWTVELVSWSKNINGAYKREQWTNTWGDKFKIIFLDDYAEELLDM